MKDKDSGGLSEGKQVLEGVQTVSKSHNTHEYPTGSGRGVESMNKNPDNHQGIRPGGLIPGDGLIL